jgi:peptidoglycan glycosyltransferase
LSVPTGDELKYLRTYPLKEQYAHLLGYKPVSGAATGIEQSENAFLAGTSDKLFGDRFRDLFTGEQTAGGNVVLTISPTAQERAFKELAANKVGAKKGAVVALDPETGAIKALVSMPSFDPNLLTTHDVDAATANYNKLLNDPDKPLLNRALSEIYEPGSVMKTIIAAAALEDGRSPSTPVQGGQFYQAPGTDHQIPNSTGVVCPDTITLIQALTVSCNTAFARLGVDLGAQKIIDRAKLFGFYQSDLAVGRLGGKGIEAGTPVAQSVLGELYNKDGKGNVTGENKPIIALSSIGQANVSMTPLQGAMIAASIANEGKQMRPYLVQELVGADLSTGFYSARAEELQRSCQKSTAIGLQQMMISVVENGTGSKARIDGYQVGGKTGTAETGEGENTHGWFVGFALKDNRPVAAVAVFLENAGKGGSAEAARIAGQVMRGVIADRAGK